MQSGQWAGDAVASRSGHSSTLLPPLNSMETFLEIIPDAVLLVDQQGLIIAANSHAARLFGYEKAELLGAQVEQLVPEALRDRHSAHRDVFHQQQQPWAVGAGIELVGRTKSGLEIPVDIALSKVTGMGAPFVLALIRDLSTRLNERRRVERARNEVQHRLLDGEEYERQRLAQALHDGPLQELHSLDFELVALARQVDDDTCREQLLELRASLRQVARHVRAVCQDLRPPALTPFGVSAVIRSYAETFQAENPALEVVLELEDDDQRLPERVRLTLYRICQHALRNVAQHAQATRVAVALKLRDAEVEMEIADDGSGFELPAEWLEFVQQGKFGLLGCVERTEAINGMIDIHAVRAKGSVLRVVAPIPRVETV
jgi:two-component system, NarL family, sensor histidine kinase NreB